MIRQKAGHHHLSKSHSLFGRGAIPRPGHAQNRCCRAQKPSRMRSTGEASSSLMASSTVAFLGAQGQTTIAERTIAPAVSGIYLRFWACVNSCWAPKGDKLAIEQTSGRERLNIHGAIDLETGQTRMIDAETIDAASTRRRSTSCARRCPGIGRNYAIRSPTIFAS
jgi:hypothetical protein